MHLNREAEGLARLKSYAPAHDLADSLAAGVSAYRELVIGEAGELARSRLQRVYGELKKLLAQALKVKFEALAKKKGLIGKDIEAIARAGAEPRVDEEHVRWEFRGEYWRDELDSYLFKIDSMCPPGAEEE